MPSKYTDTVRIGCSAIVVDMHCRESVELKQKSDLTHFENSLCFIFTIQ